MSQWRLTPEAEPEVSLTKNMTQPLWVMDYVIFMSLTLYSEMILSTEEIIPSFIEPFSVILFKNNCISLYKI